MPLQFQYPSGSHQYFPRAHSSSSQFHCHLFCSFFCHFNRSIRNQLYLFLIAHVKLHENVWGTPMSNMYAPAMLIISLCPFSLIYHFSLSFIWSHDYVDHDVDYTARFQSFIYSIIKAFFMHARSSQSYAVHTRIHVLYKRLFSTSLLLRRWFWKLYQGSKHPVSAKPNRPLDLFKLGRF